MSLELWPPDIERKLVYVGKIEELQNQLAWVRRDHILPRHTVINRDAYVRAKFVEPVNFDGEDMSRDWHTFPLRDFSVPTSKPII